MRISRATTDDQIERGYAVMRQLRPHVAEQDFGDRVRRQMERHGYRLVLLEEDGRVSAVAGFRIAECLAWGRFLHVDDLVTDEAARSRGHGRALFDWLVDHARGERCDELHLDSGVQRFAAHRFYLERRMAIASHHFSLKL